MLIGFTPAFAAKGKLIPDTLWLGGMGSQVYVENVPDNAKLISVKSSNTSVLRADKFGSEMYNMAVFPVSKTGKSRITVKYKVGKKAYTVSGVFTVKKFPKLFSTLKLNGKIITSSGTKDMYQISSYKKSKATLTYKAKSPWIVEHAEVHVIDSNDIRDITSGKSFRIPKGKEAEASIYLGNKKTGDRIRIAIVFNR